VKNMIKWTNTNYNNWRFDVLPRFLSLFLSLFFFSHFSPHYNCSLVCGRKVWPTPITIGTFFDIICRDLFNNIDNVVIEFRCVSTLYFFLYFSFSSLLIIICSNLFNFFEHFVILISILTLCNSHPQHY